MDSRVWQAPPKKSVSRSRGAFPPGGQAGLGVHKAWNLLPKKCLLSCEAAQEHMVLLSTQEQRGPLVCELKPQLEAAMSPVATWEGHLHMLCGRSFYWA